jgi:hypothetical protein
VRSLILVCGSMRFIGGIPFGVVEARATRAGEPWYAEAVAAEEALDQLDDDAPDDVVSVLEAKLEPYFYGRWDEAARAHAAAAATQFAEPARAGFYAGFRPDPTIGEKLAALQVPVVMIVGEHDAIPSPPMSRAFVAMFRNAGLVTIAVADTTRGLTTRPRLPPRSNKPGRASYHLRRKSSSRAALGTISRRITTPPLIGRSANSRPHNLFPDALGRPRPSPPDQRVVATGTWSLSKCRLGKYRWGPRRGRTAPRSSSPGHHRTPDCPVPWQRQTPYPVRRRLFRRIQATRPRPRKLCRNAPWTFQSTSVR